MAEGVDQELDREERGEDYVAAVGFGHAQLQDGDRDGGGARRKGRDYDFSAYRASEGLTGL